MSKFVLVLVMLVVIGGCLSDSKVSTDNKSAIDAKVDKSANEEKDVDLSVIVTENMVEVKLKDKLVLSKSLKSHTKEDKESTSTMGSITSAASNGTLFLIVGGGALVVLGIVLWIWLKMFRLGIALIGAGMAVGIMGVFLDWVLNEAQWVLVVLAIALLGSIVYVVYRVMQGKNKNTALTHIVNGINEATQSKNVRNAIEVAAGDEDKVVRKVVEKVKNKWQD